jgi:hypothetical protein
MRATDKYASITRNQNKLPNAASYRCHKIVAAQSLNDNRLNNESLTRLGCARGCQKSLNGTHHGYRSNMCSFCVLLNLAAVNFDWLISLRAACCLIDYPSSRILDLCLWKTFAHFACLHRSPGRASSFHILPTAGPGPLFVPLIIKRRSLPPTPELEGLSDQVYACPSLESLTAS